MTQDLLYGDHGTEYSFAQYFSSAACPKGWTPAGSSQYKPVIDALGSMRNFPANFNSANYWSCCGGAGCRSYSYLTSNGTTFKSGSQDSPSCPFKARVRCVSI